MDKKYKKQKKKGASRKNIIVSGLEMIKTKRIWSYSPQTLLLLKFIKCTVTEKWRSSHFNKLRSPPSSTEFFFQSSSLPPRSGCRRRRFLLNEDFT